MNGLDFLILGAAAVCAVRGLRRGLGREAIGLGATALLLLAALPSAGAVGRLVVGEWWPAGRPYTGLIGLALLILAVLLGAGFLSLVWRRTMAAWSLGWLDAAAGALFGLAKATLIWLVIVAVLSWLPVPAVQQALAGSVTAGALRQALPGLRRQVERMMPPSWTLPVPHAPGGPRRRPGEPSPHGWRQVLKGPAA